MTADVPSPRLGPRFDAALALASELHRAQVRKGSRIPYVSHLLAVTSLVLEHGGDEDDAIAALLHDAAEDQGGRPTLERIRAQFGDLVAGIVESLSDSLADTRSRTQDKASWAERKRAYLEHLREARPSALLVSACDKLHNLRGLVADVERDGDAVWERFNAGREDQLKFYRDFLEVVRPRAPQPLVAAYTDALLDLEQAVLRGGLAKAVAIAARAHLHQTDKGGGAYILHPLRLMFSLDEEHARTAAVLHDVVEDGEGWTLERLGREGFAPEVVEAVRHLTKVPGEDYDAFVARAAANPIARAVKRADLEDNMDVRRIGTLSPKDLDRLAKYHRNWSRLAKGDESHNPEGTTP